MLIQIPTYVFVTRHECAPNVLGFPGSIFKGYETEEEAIEMWERSLEAIRIRQAEERMANAGRNQGNVDAVPAPPSYEISVGGTHRRRNESVSTGHARNIILHESSTYPPPSPQATLRGTLIARPPPSPLRMMARSHSVDSSEGLRESGVGTQPRGSVETSYSAHSQPIARTRSLAASDRTSSWVAEMAAALPAVPESLARTEATQSRTRGTDVGSRSPLLFRQSPDERRATVDTSYTDAVSVSSNESSVSDELALPPRSSQQRPLASSSAPEVWIDSSFHSQSPLPLRTQARANRITASASLPVPRVTQTVPNSPRRTASSRAGSSPESWATPLSRTPSSAGNLVSLPESLRPSPARSSRIAAAAARAQSQSQPRMPERRTTSVSSSGCDVTPAEAALICQCRHPVCLCCHLPIKPASACMGGFGFTQPPHVANVVDLSNLDPRSPVRRGGTRVPMQ